MAYIWFFTLALCTAIQSLATKTYSLKGRASPSADWTQVGAAPADELVELAIGLKHHRFEEFERVLAQVSNPSHATYGQWLSLQEIQEFIRPAKDSVEAVSDWLTTCDGFDAAEVTTSSAGDWMYVPIAVSTLECLLQAKYHVYRHIEDRHTVIRTTEWYLPEELIDVIDVVEPANAFVRPRAQLFYGAPEPSWEHNERMPTFDELVEEDLLERGKIEIPSAVDLPADPSVREACNRIAISPLCLRVLYGTLEYSVQNPQGKGVGIVNFLGESANRSDVRRYLEAYRPDAAIAGADKSFSVTLLAGADDRQEPNTPEQMTDHKGYEGALDTQTVLGISWPIPLSLYNVGGKPPFRAIGNHTKNNNEPYLTWLKYMKTQERLPSVISISYAEDEKSVPEDYARRVCAEFGQLGARGVSILVASGDYGVGQQRSCASEEGQTKRFAPSFPASCPYVTAVGATRFLAPEIVAFDARNNFSSGGGFSNVFARPSYQTNAVEGYLGTLGDRFDGLYNPSGRAIPDISASGYHYAVMWNGTARLQDGTSASTPTVAAIIALLNDALEAEGHSPMGFLNPWIYSTGYVAFQDVTLGSNDELGCNRSGFPAAEGWDPATGFGTPWFPKVKELALRSRFREGVPWYYLGNS